MGENVLSNETMRAEEISQRLHHLRRMFAQNLEIMRVAEVRPVGEGGDGFLSGVVKEFNSFDIGQIPEMGIEKLLHYDLVFISAWIDELHTDETLRYLMKAAKASFVELSSRVPEDNAQSASMKIQLFARNAFSELGLCALPIRAHSWVPSSLDTGNSMQKLRTERCSFLVCPPTNMSGIASKLRAAELLRII